MEKFTLSYVEASEKPRKSKRKTTEKHKKKHNKYKRGTGKVLDKQKKNEINL